MKRSNAFSWNNSQWGEVGIDCLSPETKRKHQEQERERDNAIRIDLEQEDINEDIKQAEKDEYKSQPSLLSRTWNILRNVPTARPTEPIISANWIGTYHSPEGDGDDLRFNFDPNHSGITYLRGQWEFGRQGGRPHFQFVVITKKPQRETGIRKLLCNVANESEHFRGYLKPINNLDGALGYVSKEATRLGERMEYGVAPAGKSLSSGYTDAVEMAKAGSSYEEIAERFPGAALRHHAGLAKLISSYQKQRKLVEPPEVIIYYGPTGTGKSTLVANQYPDAYRKMGNPKWWNGYRGQSEVIFEEFNPIDPDQPYQKWSLQEMLQILDRFGYQGEIKGSAYQLQAKTFIFTTNINPSLWWNGHQQQPAFQRRVTKIFYMDKKISEMTEEERDNIHANLQQVKFTNLV